MVPAPAVWGFTKEREAELAVARVVLGLVFLGLGVTASHVSVIHGQVRSGLDEDRRVHSCLRHLGLFVGEHARCDPADAFGVGDRVDLDDLASRDRERHHSEWTSLDGNDHSG
jgi:hypothetical protein